MNKSLLITGDLLVLAILTLIGFASHREVELSFLPRMAAVFVPLSISWFLLAPALGLYERESVSEPRQLLRAALAALFAASLAAVLRGFILESPVIPIFAVILAGTSALGMVMWRALFLSWIRKQAKPSA